MQRIKSLDLARGFTVLMIAPIHTVMLYSKPEIRETLLGKTLALIAEWHGAQVFMLLMGISFALSSKQTIQTVSKRALYILIAAYLLNILKFVIPHLFGLSPEPLLAELQIQEGPNGFVQLFLIGDILHFAAISLMILLLVYNLPNPIRASLLFAATICLLSPFFWDDFSNNYVIDYFLQLTGGHPPQVFFPLLPWLIYPLTGLSIGTYFRRTRPQRVFWLLRDTGWFLIIAGFVCKYVFHENDTASFYRTYPYATICHLGAVLVALSCWEWISINVKQNHFFRLLVYLSENITQVYIIQWILICWLLPALGYHTFGLVSSMLCILLTTALTLVISFFINAISKKGVQPKIDS